MTDILEELYYGNISPHELSVPKDPEYASLGNRLSEITEELKSSLSEVDCRKLTAIINLQSELAAMENKSSFLYGFKLGAAIMLEATSEKDELF